MSKQDETKFKEKVFKDLKTLDNCWFFKNVAGSVRGIPDVLICLNGMFIAIELKVGTKLTMLQSYNLTEIQKSGGWSYTANPENWKEIFQELKEIK